MEEKIEWASRGEVSMDEDQYRKKMAELLRMSGSVQRSLGESERLARLEGIAMCFEASVKIGTGTGESAAQVMARAKDLHRMAQAWAAEPAGKVRK